MQLERPWTKSWPKGVPKSVHVEPKPLFTVLTESAKRSPSSPCLFYQGRTLPYSEVDELSSRFASSLARMGVGKGDRVGIFLPNTPQFVISYFGILKAGGVAVACSPLYKARELEVQLSDSGAKVVVAARDIVKKNDLYQSLEEARDKLSLEHVITTSVTDFLPPLKKRLAGLAGVKNLRRQGTEDFSDLLRDKATHEKFPDIDPMEDLAVLQYTGGTTGTVKGAMLTHYNLLSNAVGLSLMLPITDKDVALAVLPLFHIYGMSVVMNPTLYSGAQLVLLPSFHVDEVMGAIEKRHVTVFCGVPTMYIAIISSPKVGKFDMKTVRSCISGGAALPVQVRKKFIELTGGSLVEGYGLTEASPVTHCNPVHDGVVKDGSVGIPIVETEAAIVDQEDPDKFLGTGEVGELAVKGAQVMKGYWNQPEQSAAVLRNGWLLTGDIAKMDSDGYFYIVDRKKDMVNVGGFKVYPREVEEVLFEHPAVKEASVIGIPDDFSGEAVKAFVVLKDPSSKVTEKEIIDFCAERLAKFKVPKKVDFVPDLPKSLVGKVLRRKLRETSAQRS
ncbi:MAG TPA: long-chain fatty acid--CoA ligase [Nitrososphaerales archaeon]|nr:long-chain fatty acid--CoA ligase [Nitrososphaerales archaeon]